MQKWLVVFSRSPDFKKIREKYPQAKMLRSKQGEGFKMEIMLPSDIIPSMALSRFVGGPSGINSGTKIAEKEIVNEI